MPESRTASIPPGHVAGLSPKGARATGLFYLGTIVAGIYAEVFARSALIVSGNGPATADNILSHQALYRSGLVADLVMLCCYIVVTVLLYELFRSVSRQLSLLAAGFSLTGIAVLAANGILHMAALSLSQSALYPGAFGAGQAGGPALLALDLHSQGYNISLVFFGFYCVLIGILAFRSGFLPRVIGLLMLAAGLCYLINSFAWLASPDMARGLPSWILYPTLIGEAALSLWLIMFGRGRPLPR